MGKFKELQKNKRKQRFVYLIAPLFVVLVYITIIFIVYTNKLIHSGKEIVETQVDGVLKYYCSEAEKKFQNVASAASPIAAMIENDEITEKHALEMLCNQLPVENVAIVNLDGIGKDVQGETVEIADFNSHGTLKIDSVLYMDSEDGIINIIIPIVRDNTISQALVLYYNTDQLEDIFEENEFKDDTWICLVDSDGLVINSFKSEETDYLGVDSNLFILLRDKGKNGASIINNIHRGRSGNMLVSFNDGDKNVHYVYMKSTCWSMIMSASNKYINDEIKDLRNTVLSMIKWLVLGVVLFIGILFLNRVLESDLLKQKSDGLIKLAETDQLTGLFNKVTTEQRIREFVENNPNTQSMMFVLDVDNFKKINDTMGHSFGDEVLKDIGNGLKAQFRSSDIIGRAGGDEFIILLKGLKTDEFLLRESRKLDLFFKNLQVGGYVKYSVSASIGACVFPRDADNFENLYKRADEALYKAKQKGKNQVAFYSPIDGKTGVLGEKFSSEDIVIDKKDESKDVLVHVNPDEVGEGTSEEA